MRIGVTGADGFVGRHTVDAVRATPAAPYVAGVGLRGWRRIVRERRPILLVERAVYGMLPKTRLGDRLFTKLKVYAGPEHPHKAQCPRDLAVNE